MKNPVKAAVLGVGYLGQHHAQKYQVSEHSHLVAVCDVDRKRCDEIAQHYSCHAVYDYRELLDQVEAVSIVVPTPLHYPIAKACLEKGIHVLLEKPMTRTIEEAESLIQIAAGNNCVLQIGHLERFNATLKAAISLLGRPQFIESFRLAPFNQRGSDVSVILDLMIHDIDIIQFIVKSPIEKIDANGASVLSSHTDMANARITFKNGCVANVTASRISLKPRRKLRIFQPNAYIVLDLHNKKMAIQKYGMTEMFPGVPAIQSTEQVFEHSDALLDEIESFLKAIRTKGCPQVTGEDGLSALRTATEIMRIVTENPQHNMPKQGLGEKISCP